MSRTTAAVLYLLTFPAEAAVVLLGRLGVRVPAVTAPCDRCDGMREVYVHERISEHAHLTKRIPCPDCDGTGAVEVTEHG